MSIVTKRNKLPDPIYNKHKWKCIDANYTISSALNLIKTFFNRMKFPTFYQFGQSIFVLWFIWILAFIFIEILREHSDSKTCRT